jgi:hypothetical protein
MRKRIMAFADQCLSGLVFLDMLSDVKDEVLCPATAPISAALTLLGLPAPEFIKTGADREFFDSVRAATKAVVLPEVYMTFERGTKGVAAPRFFERPTLFDIVRATWPHAVDTAAPISIKGVDGERLYVRVALELEGQTDA